MVNGNAVKLLREMVKEIDNGESKCRHARRSHLEGSFVAMRQGSVGGVQGSSTSTLVVVDCSTR